MPITQKNIAVFKQVFFPIVFIAYVWMILGQVLVRLAENVYNTQM